MSAQRYEYFKVGKVLGLETRRFLSLSHGHLFYFNVPAIKFRTFRIMSTWGTATSRTSMCSGLL